MTSDRSNNFWIALAPVVIEVKGEGLDVRQGVKQGLGQTGSLSGNLSTSEVNQDEGYSD